MLHTFTVHISTAKYLHQDNSIVFKTIPENYDHSNLEHTQVEKPNNRAKHIVAVLKFCPFLHSVSFIIWRSILFFCFGVITQNKSKQIIMSSIFEILFEVENWYLSYLKVVSLDLKDVACTKYVDGVIKLYSA